MRVLAPFLALLALAAPAAADDVKPADKPAQQDEVFLPPMECFAAPHKWAYNRAKETVGEAGARFLEDMRKCAPTFAASVTEAVRYEIQTDETQVFARHSKFVMWAYGIAWALVALCAVLLLLRQDRLNRQIVDLERRLVAASKQGKP